MSMEDYDAEEEKASSEPVYRRNPNRNIEERSYTNHEFFGCALKMRHPNWLSAVLHIRRLSYERPLAHMKIYLCRFCDGLHVTTGRADKGYFKLLNSLEFLKKRMATQGYIDRAPKEIKARHAQILIDLQARIQELNTLRQTRECSTILRVPKI